MATHRARAAADRHGERIIQALRRIVRAADMDSRKLAAERQITAPQLLCLLAAVDEGETTATDIARRVHLSASTVVGILDRLEEKGLVRRERDAEDRRVVHVSPTGEGRDVAARTPYPLQFTLGRKLALIPLREREQIARSMERLVYLVGAGSLQAGPMLEIAAVARRVVREKRRPRRAS